MGTEALVLATKQQKDAHKNIIQTMGQSYKHTFTYTSLTLNTTKYIIGSYQKRRGR